MNTRIILLLIIFSCKTFYHNNIILNIWINKDINWVYSKDFPEYPPYARAELLYFSKDGIFERLLCDVYLKNGVIYIDHHNYIIYKGSWKIENKNVLVQYKIERFFEGFIMRDFLQEKKEIIKISKNEKLIYKKREFVVLKNFDKKSFGIFFSFN